MIAAPKSSDSRMRDEYDMRMSFQPISTAMLSNAPWITLAVTASMGRRFGVSAMAQSSSPRRRMRFALLSTRTDQPGGTTVVASVCTIIAGPGIGASTGSASRR